MDDHMVETMPIGFRMELAKDPRALEYFNSLPEEKQRSLIEGARGAGSKQKMSDYVNSITMEF